MGSEQKIVLKKPMRSLYDNVIANGEICMKPYETIVYEVLAVSYTHLFVGVMLDWIKRGMKEAPEEIANMVCVTMHGNVGNSLRNMEKEWQ